MKWIFRQSVMLCRMSDDMTLTMMNSCILTIERLSLLNYFITSKLNIISRLNWFKYFNCNYKDICFNYERKCSFGVKNNVRR